MMEAGRVLDRPGIPEELDEAIPRVSWGALFAGLVVSLGILCLLALLGIAVGATAVKPAEPGGFSGIGVGAGIWSVLCYVISIGCGAYVSARLSGVQRPILGMFHGLGVWAAIVVLTFVAVGSGITGAIKGTLGVVGQVAAKSAESMKSSDDPFTDLRSRVKDPKEKDKAVQLLVAVGVTRDEARDLVNEAARSSDQGEVTPELQGKIDHAKEKAAATAQAVTRSVAKAAWWSFFTMLIALLVALVAGGSGVGVPLNSMVDEIRSSRRTTGGLSTGGTQLGGAAH